jgi:23S rRNA-/tRNA-specific pseudouridylate synthase
MPEDGRLVSLQWEMLSIIASAPEFTMLRVQTGDGSRHMVRALLAQVGKCPIQGDLRYGTSNLLPLKDQSVALHAFRVSLDPSLKLGSLETFDFEAPWPQSWKTFFGANLDAVVGKHR